MYLKVSLLQYMNGRTMIKMKTLSCLDSRQQRLTLKLNLVSALQAVKVQMETEILFSHFYDSD